MTQDNRKLPLAAAVNDGRLVVSIGLDTLDALRKRIGVDFGRVSAADIADFLADPLECGLASSFELAIRDACVKAKAWDEENEETTEPSTEFFR